MVPTKNERWLDHTGLNLIRIVIGSYFMAISLGVIGGVDPAALFAQLLEGETAALAGTGVLCTLSALFMSGLYLRSAALALAVFVLCSSLAQNLLAPGPLGLSALWRDITMVCAILMTYATLRRHELRKAALFMRRRAARFSQGSFSKVTPRRVTVRNRPVAQIAGKAAGRAADNPDYDRVLRPLIAPTGPIQRPEPPIRPRADLPAPETHAQDHDTPQKPFQLTKRLRLAPPQAEGEDEIDNIFSNI